MLQVRYYWRLEQSNEVIGCLGRAISFGSCLMSICLNSRRRTMSKKLEGKVALITGDSRGIGAEGFALAAGAEPRRSRASNRRGRVSVSSHPADDAVCHGCTSR